MPQIFPRQMNTVARVSIFGAVLFLTAAFWVLAVVARSPYVTEAGVIREQPVPFSHKHHVGDVGLDCRYCHTSVEQSSFAGIPPTKVCMNCHSQLWTDSPMLEPVRVSFRTGKPLQWTRVHNLPDFVYFDHSIHVYKGIGCVTCHGRVDEMPLMWRENTLLMEWCVNCHRHPEQYVRPRQEVFAMDWQPPADRAALAKAWMVRQHVQSKTDCYTCHR
jgi:Zn ribbon nucleic-acid-binding protein